ncbi:hypothetical protein FM106_08940 [Brachybacterium faecium]|nr:hypothetical protein FM106_08940 [Brachybacterium faecium]
MEPRALLTLPRRGRGAPASERDPAAGPPRPFASRPEEATS